MIVKYFSSTLCRFSEPSAAMVQIELATVRFLQLGYVNTIEVAGLNAPKSKTAVDT